MASAVPRLIQCRAGSRIGFPLMLPLSLRNAITDPEKVIAPIATPRPISTRLTPRIAPECRRSRKRTELRNAAAPTSTAAMPTSEWKAATSCGIAVIWMRRAVTRPIAPPISIAAANLDRCDAISCSRERGDDRDRHAGHAEPVAASAARRAGQATKREDEADAGDQIGHQAPTAGRAPRPQCIASAPSSCTWRAFAAVTAKPPKMFTLASATRDQAEPFGAAGFRRPRRRSAPRRRSPTIWRWLRSSAACAAPESPTRRRNSRRSRPGRRSTGSK